MRPLVPAIANALGALLVARARRANGLARSAVGASEFKPLPARLKRCAGLRAGVTEARASRSGARVPGGQQK